MKLTEVKINEAGMFGNAVGAVKNFAGGAANAVRNANKPMDVTAKQKQPTPQPAQQPQQAPQQGVNAIQQFIEIVKKNGANLRAEDIKVIRKQLHALMKQKQPPATVQAQKPAAPVQQGQNPPLTTNPK